MAPLIKYASSRKLNYFIIHTNQHYSRNMDKVFFDELELPHPAYNLNVGSGLASKQTGLMLERIETVLLKELPDIVLVEGDTNTVLAGALAASKLGIKTGHVEAGLRSYDRTMPEEINRIVTDHASDFLFCPTEKSRKIALGEGIPAEKLFVTGNTIVDSVFQHIELAKKKSGILEKLHLGKDGYFLLTAHRPSNVDTKDALHKLLSLLKNLYSEFKCPIIYPVHPRTKKNLEAFKLKLPDGVRLIEPVGFLDFLYLEKNAKLIITDSGGVQEEACILKIPCITIRENTERPETVDVGANMLVGLDMEKALLASKKMIAKERNWKNPFGDGSSAEKIMKIIEQHLR